MSDAEMVYLTNINGLNVYVADNTFEKPGLWYWDGTRNVHPVSEIATLTEQLDASQALLAEARAEVERLKVIKWVQTESYEAVAAVEQARQEAAREIIQYIEAQGMIQIGYDKTLLYEIDDSDITELKKRFGLEG